MQCKLLSLIMLLVLFEGSVNVIYVDKAIEIVRFMVLHYLLFRYKNITFNSHLNLEVTV